MWFSLIFTYLPSYFNLSFTVFFHSSVLMHPDLHTDLDNLDSVENNLRHSAKGASTATTSPSPSHITLANGIPPRKAMVMAGENAIIDVDEEVYGNDGAERHEAQEASAGDRRAIADADQAGQLDISGETRTARTLRTPEPPTDAVRMAHNATHVPFRDWCPICVASRGRSSPHRRVVVNKTADTLPNFQTDYMFIRTVAETKTQPCITFVETRSGVVISFMCARKGGYEDLTKEILRHFEAYGFLNPVILQCDTEMSIIDVCRKVARERHARTVFTICAKNKSSEQRVCRSSARTHSGTRTILPDTNRDEHWHTAFSNVTCHSTCDSSRWICALKIHSATRRQNAIPIFAWNSILSLLCMFGRVDPRPRSGSSQADEQMDQWLLVGTRRFVGRTPGGDEAWFFLKCRSVRRKPPGEQWSRRETVEARGTKWNFAVEMDSGIPGPTLEPRPDEGMSTATTQGKIPTVPPPAPPPEEYTPEMRGQGVHAKAFRIRAFWSEIGRTPGCPACETPGPGSHTLENARRIKMPGKIAAESSEQQRRRRCGGQNGDDDLRPILLGSCENEGDW